MEAQPKRKKRTVSLKWGLIMLICISWILPIVVILLVSSRVISGNLEQQIRDLAITSAEKEIEMTQSRLASLMAASKKPSYDTTIRDAYARYLDDGDTIALYAAATGYLVREYRYEEHVKASLLYFTFDPDAFYYTLSRHYAGSTNKVNIYREYVHPVIKAAARAMGTEIRFINTDYGVFMVRNIVDSSYRPYAVIVHELDVDALLQNTCSIIWLEALSVGLDDVPLQASGYPPAYFYNEVFTSYNKDTGSLYISTYRRLEGHTVWYSVVSSGRQLLDQVPQYNEIALIIVALSIPLIVLLIAMFYKHVSRPAERLAAASARVEAGEMGFVLEEQAPNKEFYDLTEHFNSMSMRLKEQFERIYMEQQALQDSRIKALQSQINPHFLNNTLEIINWEARMAGDEKVSSMIEALSTMLNAAMARDERPYVELREELRYVDAYLYIISVRFGKRLQVERDIDESLLGQLVPRLVMQPIVENAVDHGVAGKRMGRLRLHIYREGARIMLEVENDNPLSEQDAATIEALLSWDGDERPSGGSGHIGIRNVQLRLKMLYGEAYGLSILPGGLGTIARITLPYRPEQRPS